MIKSFKLFEELKRKAPPGIDINQVFGDKTNDFTPSEIKILQDDDFEVNKNVAINKEENYFEFEIIKTANEDFCFYQLIIKNKDGGVIHDKKFKIDEWGNQRERDFLDYIIDICAVVKNNFIKNLHKDIDPYGEEDWEGGELKPDKRMPFDFLGAYQPEPLNVLNRRVGVNAVDDLIRRRREAELEIVNRGVDDIARREEIRRREAGGGNRVEVVNPVDPDFDADAYIAGREERDRRRRQREANDRAFIYPQNERPANARRVVKKPFFKKIKDFLIDSDIEHNDRHYARAHRGEPEQGGA